MNVVNYLLGYENLKIYQNSNMFNFSLDSILLPNFVTINKSFKNVLEIGSGNAVIPLVLSTKTKAKITGIEIQKEAFDLAVKSVNINDLQNQIQIYNEAIKEYYKKLATDSYDLILSNPPYFKVTENSNLNDSEFKLIARHEVTLNVEDVIVIAKKLLKNNGVLGIVHRPERLIEIIETMRKNNIEPKRIQFVYPKKDKEANILLIEGAKNGKPGLKIEPPIYTHNVDGSYTDQVKKYFE